jgi:hypothetical protein
MRRIIQKYQEGGVVQSAPGPAVATGIPQGGHAAAAIQSYLSGQAAGPLSYTAGQSTVPDYRALADSRRKLRESLAASGLDAATQSSIVDEADIINIESTNAGKRGGTDSTTYGGHKDVAHQNVDEAFDNYAQILSETKPLAPLQVSPVTVTGSKDGVTYNGYGAGEATAAVLTPKDVQEANPGYNAEMAAANIYNTDVTGRSDSLGGETISPSEQYARSMLAAGVKGVGGGYNQNDPTTGLVGTVKDVYGNITSGLKNAIDDNALLSLLPGATLASSVAAPISTYTAIPESAPVYTYVAPVTQTEDGSSDFHKQMVADHQARVAAETKAIQSDMSDDDFWDAWEGNNMGGPIGPRVQTYNNGSIGGVAVAKSGLREDEIRQRQLMQARMPQVEASPLSAIGSKLAMGAVDKGIGSAASSMAAKEGLVGTLGNALGGSAATGAATGAAGTGMMAALGPIGIGIGLGKLFGLFNDGGKVPCSCGKTSCKCAKEMKSPLSGE